jgi:hypothetical protein
VVRPFYVVVYDFEDTTPVIRTYAYNRATNKWVSKAAPDFAGATCAPPGVLWRESS